MRIRFREWLTRSFTPLTAGLFVINVMVLGWAAFALVPDEVLPPIIQPAPHVLTIRVPQPIITERVVTKYVPVEDRAQASALLQENEDLKIRVDQLSVSLAQATSRGQGTLTFPTPSTPTPTTPAFTFRDWRLFIEGQGTQVSYTLTQKFSVVNSVGQDRHGVPTQLIRLYEIGPNQERWPVPITETTTLAATPDTEGWYVKPTVQAGVSTLLPLSPVSGTPRAVGGVFALPWLKHGTTRSVEDTRWAFLTPSLTVTGQTWTVGVLPVSFNLGSLPHQPFSDVWVSPFIGRTRSSNLTHGGVALTVTF